MAGSVAVSTELRRSYIKDARGIRAKFRSSVQTIVLLGVSSKCHVPEAMLELLISNS